MRRRRSSITWAFATPCAVRRWPTPTSKGIGRYTRHTLIISSTRHDRCTRETVSISISPTSCTLWTRRRLICVYRYFPGASFRSTKAAVKMHTLLDLRGSIPSFIHISDGKMGDVSVLDIVPPEPGAFYVMDRGYLDFARLYALHQAGAFFVTRAKSNFVWRRCVFGRDRSERRPRVRSHYRSRRRRQPQALPRKIQTHQIQRARNRQDLRLSDQQFHPACIDDLRSLQNELASGAVFQMDQNNTCASSDFSARAKTPSRRKSGAPSASMC